MDLPLGVVYFIDKLSRLFLSLGSSLSLTSLFCTFCIAVGFIVIRRRRRNRAIRLRAIARALFPKRMLCPSTYTDLGFFYYNVFVHGLAFGWAFLSYDYLTNGLIAGLVAVFGPVTPSALPNLVTQPLIAIALFLGYEIGYWLDHYLSHRVPFLWQFHRVHHSAEVLTPLTNFRVHPVDTIVFFNILTVTMAVANAAAHYALGDTSHQYASTGSNVIVIVFFHLYLHLQHSELWIPFRGILGHIFLSPAHHQVHHSDNPAHFDRNFGACLAVWDWLFGTLYIPKQEREKLRFGVESDRFPAHTITGEFFAPFIRAAALFKPKSRAIDTQPLPQPEAERVKA